MAKHKLLVFDTETNGFRGSSVLSISMRLMEIELHDSTLKLINFVRQVDIIRYYMPVEYEFNQSAVDVHKLDEAKITLKRKESKEKYALHFLQDRELFDIFKDEEILFIGHNIGYDKDFIRIPLKKTFCTMLSNTNIVKIPGPYNKYKWPTLTDTANYYKVIKETEGETFHEADYDTKLTALIVWKMLKNRNEDLLKALGYSEHEIFEKTSN